MWAYNRLLKVTVNGRSSVWSSVWQKPPSVTKCAFSTALLQKTHLSPQRPFLVTAVFQACVQGKILKKGIHVSRYTGTAVETNLPKDVVIFKLDNQRHHRVITLFAIVNYLMFMTIATNIFTLLTTPPKSEGEESSEFDTENGSSNIPVNQDNVQANNSASTNVETADDSGDLSTAISTTLILKALCGVTFALGCLILSGAWLYCNHSVRYIVLLKGGQKATVVTHGFFAKNRFYTYDVDKLSCRGNRAISSAVLLNAKGKYFSYILDKKGIYTNPQLFDATVGVLRDLRN